MRDSETQSNGNAPIQQQPTHYVETYVVQQQQPNYPYNNGYWYNGYQYNNGYFYNNYGQRAYSRNTWNRYYGRSGTYYRR